MTHGVVENLLCHPSATNMVIFNTSASVPWNITDIPDKMVLGPRSTFKMIGYAYDDYNCTAALASHSPSHWARIKDARVRYYYSHKEYPTFLEVEPRLVDDESRKCLTKMLSNKLNYFLTRKRKRLTEEDDDDDPEATAKQLAYLNSLLADDTCSECTTSSESY